MTLGGYLNGWLGSLPAVGRRPSTIESYRRVLKRHIIPALGHLKLQKLGPLDLDRIYATMLATGKSGSSLSHRTVRFTHTVIGKALADAQRKGLVQRNVARLASPPSAVSSRAPEMTIWSRPSFRRFLSLAVDHHHGALFRLAAMTGLRRAELCGLYWSDVDLDAARLTVRRSLAVRGQLIDGEPKTARGRRSVDLVRGDRSRPPRPSHCPTRAASPGRRGVLRPRLRVRGTRRHTVEPRHNGQAFERLVTRSELPRIRFHDLRHTHASHLSPGVNIKIVSERLGHASMSFTLDIYGHVMPGQQAYAAAAVVGSRRRRWPQLTHAPDQRVLWDLGLHVLERPSASTLPRPVRRGRSPRRHRRRDHPRRIAASHRGTPRPGMAGTASGRACTELGASPGVRIAATDRTPFGNLES